MTNLLIRTKLIENGVRNWELAERILHISEPTLYRKLRNELPYEEQERIAVMISEYAKNKKEGRKNED